MLLTLLSRTKSHMSTNFLDSPRTCISDKRDDFDFAIVNFPFLCTNIPLSSAYGVYMSQLIRYARACFVYDDFKTWQPDDKKS